MESQHQCFRLYYRMGEDQFFFEDVVAALKSVGKIKSFRVLKRANYIMCSSEQREELMVVLEFLKAIIDNFGSAIVVPFIFLSLH